MSFSASAPGSLMLLGEYAVLHGKLALVCAINKRMKVNLQPRTDTQIAISSALGEFKTDLTKINIEPPFHFVLAVIKKFQNKMRCGCDIRIEAEFSEKVGFASSAAVTVATLSVISMWMNLSLSKMELARTACTIIRAVQGLGSGADVAACVFGGIVAYRAQPFSIESLPHHYPLTAIYSGSKTPTVEAVTHVKNLFRDKPRLFKQLCQAIDHCALQGKQAIQEKNWPEFGKLMNIQQGLLDALGVNTAVLNSIVNELREQPNILGAKISGSGLGDCVVGLGSPCHAIRKGSIVHIPIEITPQGVHCEKN